MTITLTPEAEALVCKCIAAGMYSTPQEAVEDCIHILLDPHEDDEGAALREAIREGFEEIERGEYREYTDPGALAREIITEGRALRAKRAAQSGGR